MGPSALAAFAGSGVTALGLALALVAAGCGVLLLSVGLFSRWVPRLRVFLNPVHMAIVVLQLLDGATTWVGVRDPFNLGLPLFQETVLASAWVIDSFGGGAFFLLKGGLAVVVVLTLDTAMRAAVDWRDKFTTRGLQAALLVMGTIPVVNNVSNFLAIA